MPKKKTDSDLSLEDALTELETIVETMESGDLSLEQSLEQFERGIALTKTCQTSLKSAEQKIKLLTKDQTLEDFDPPTDED